MSKNRPALLEIRDLCLEYQSGKRTVPALNRMDLTLKPGETLGLIGESGCGKSSLAMAIMGLVKSARVSGSIQFDGQDLTAMGEKERASLRWNRMALVFQNSQEVFNPVITVGEQVAEALCTHLGMDRKKADNRTARLFEQVGLDALWRKAFPHQLSGGMRQRVLMAMAISCTPDLLIVDEPFTALDAAARAAMGDLLQTLQKRLGFAMILISHNMPAILHLTNRTMTLYAGQVLETGPTRSVLTAPLHPYTRGLINACPEFYGYKDLWGIPGIPPVPGQARGCPFHPRCVQRGKECATQRPALASAGPQRQVACHKGGIETLLQARGIQKTYFLDHTPIQAIRQVDIQVKTGEIVALVGASGSGKSTLAHVLVHMETPDAGEVRFRGRRLLGREMTARMGGMQIVFQDPSQAISPRLRVLEAVREPLDIMAWKKRPDRDQKARGALEAVHLPVDPGFLNQTCHALSGGQRQRISVARAMVTDPELLIADEITAMLDPSAQAVLIRQLKGLQHANGFAMLFITHDLHLARKIADRAYVMDRGCIVAQGAGFEVFSSSSQVPEPAAGLFPTPLVRPHPGPAAPKGALDPIPLTKKETFA